MAQQQYFDKQQLSSYKKLTNQPPVPKARTVLFTIYINKDHGVLSADFYYKDALEPMGCVVGNPEYGLLVIIYTERFFLSPEYLVYCLNHNCGDVGYSSRPSAP
jgi:hypothetical protein